MTYSKEGGKLTASFHNPSIRDFLQSHCVDSPEDTLKLIQNAVFFEQLMWIAEFKLEGNFIRAFQDVITSNSLEFAEALERTIDSQGCGTSISWGWNNGAWSMILVKSVQAVEYRLLALIELENSIPNTQLEKLIANYADKVIERCLDGKADRDGVVRIVEMLSDEDIGFSQRQEFIEAVEELLSNDLDDLEKFELATRCMMACGGGYTVSFTERVRTAFTSFTEEGLQSWIDGTESEDADEIRECANTLGNVAEILDLDVSDSLSALEETAEEKEALANFDPVHDEERLSLSGLPSECSDAEIASMFNTLPIE